jgi:hypothetical protein
MGFSNLAVIAIGFRGVAPREDCEGWIDRVGVGRNNLFNRKETGPLAWLRRCCCLIGDVDACARSIDRVGDSVF